MRNVIILVISVVSFIGSSTSFADPWRITKYGKSSPFYGAPFKVLKVKVVKEIIRDGKAYYQYKMILQRPSWDDSTGVVKTNTLNLRLYYFAASPGLNPYWSLYKGLTVGQHKKKGHPGKIVIYLFEGFQPSRLKRRIRIGAIPYPMVAGYSVKSAVGIYRSDYVSLLEFLLEKTTLAGVVIGKVKDMTIDSILDRTLTYYGAVVEMEVLAKVPGIRGIPVETAIRELRMRTLKPHITGYVSTNKRRLHNRVKGYSRRINYVDGNRVRAGTQLHFNVWKYIGDNKPNHRYGKEICGDGVDNDGDNLIDEDCYKKYIIIDDWQCKDDVTGLYIDGRRIGSSPPGRKKYFNMNWLSKGYHTLTIEAVSSYGKRMGCDNTDDVTYSVKLGPGIKFAAGSTYANGILHAKGNKRTKYRHYKIKSY